MKKYLIFAVMPLALFSCQDEPVIPEVEPCEDYNIMSPNQITIGDTSGMIVRTDLGYIASGIEVNDQLEIMLNCQSTADFTLISQTGGGLGAGGYWENITLVPQSNLKFHQELNGDTLYHFSDTIYNGSNPVYFGVTTGEHCANESSTHYAAEISDKLIYHAIGDVIAKTDNFTSETETLRTSEYSHNTGSQNVNDTISIQVYNYDHTCNNMAEMQAVYVAFKKEVDGETKLGWIKIYHEYNVKTEILEYAIQE